MPHSVPPETSYIETDEEIIGAVSRLRKSKAIENIFVFPKRALILQSIINLKLLAREAEKLGKIITVMSQDEQGMRLAEKAGLRIQEYHDAALREQRQGSDARFTVKHGESIPMLEKPVLDGGLRRSSEIGSATFYAGPPTERVNQLSSALPPSMPPVPRPERTLRVRNMSPPMQTALNSRRETSPVPSAPSIPLPPPALPPVSSNAPMSQEDPRKAKLRRLFQQPEPVSGLAALRPRDPVTPPPTSSMGSKQVRRERSGSSWFWFFLSFLLVVGIVVLGYVFLRPEAVVIIEPQEADQMMKRSFFGVAGASVNEEAIPVRLIEQEKTVRFSRPATGKDLGNAGKASGTITIINNHSPAPQSLVVTTRFETTDGKVYRLSEGVTVPGVQESGGTKTAGRIDARVVADASGSTFNITSGTFRIPGFKGGPKYETITAEVKSAFVGGGDGAAGGTLSVSTDDLDQAKEAAAEEAKKTVFADVQSSLAEGEALLEKSFQAALIGTPVTPPIGTVVNSSFEYEARFQVKGFVLSLDALRARIAKETITSGGVTLVPAVYEIGYGAVLSNFEAKRVDFTVENRVAFRAPLDEGDLKEKLLGLNEEGIRTFLEEHPEIKRLQVEFKPKVFIATIPTDPERVTLEFRSAETE